jgi:protein ImuA
MIPASKAGLVATLQADLLRLQGFKNFNNPALDLALGPISNAFPNKSFPLAAVHEFISDSAESSVAISGFVASVLSPLMGANGTVIWISTSRTIFPPALRCFGLQPHQFIFIDTRNEREAIWAMNEALKCEALSAVVGEIRDLNFTASRRLQLTVEESKVTGFILRKNWRTLNTTACVSRWKVRSMSSEPIDDMPGVGYPKWKVELLRVRNGRPDTWEIKCVNGKLVPVYENVSENSEHQLRSAVAG